MQGSGAGGKVLVDMILSQCVDGCPMFVAQPDQESSGFGDLLLCISSCVVHVQNLVRASVSGVEPPGECFEGGADIWLVCESVESVLVPCLEPREPRIAPVRKDMQAHQHCMEVLGVPARCQRIERVVRKHDLAIPDFLQKRGNGFTAHPGDDALRPRDVCKFGNEPFQPKV